MRRIRLGVVGWESTQSLSRVPRQQHPARLCEDIDGVSGDSALEANGDLEGADAAHRLAVCGGDLDARWWRQLFLVYSEVTRSLRIHHRVFGTRVRCGIHVAEERPGTAMIR